VTEDSPAPDPRDESLPPNWQIRFVRRLPLHLVVAPERVVLNVGFLLMGVASIATPRGRVLAALPPWAVLTFIVGMGVGGVLVLVGLFRGKTSAERLGYLMVMVACFMYGVATLYVRGLPGLPVALIFLSFAAMKILRLIISTAEREMIVEIGRRLRDQDRRDQDQRDRDRRGRDRRDRGAS
jgi:hypothetical protein